MSNGRPVLSYASRERAREAPGVVIASFTLLFLAGWTLVGAEHGRQLGGFEDEGPLEMMLCAVVCLFLNGIGMILAVSSRRARRLGRSAMLGHVFAAAVAFCYLVIP